MKVDTMLRGRRAAATPALAAALLLAGLLPGGLAAQSVDFEPLLHARETTALLERDGVVIGGIAGGGLVLWPASDPAQGERVTAGADLSGNDVTDLAWSGRSVWVATMGGGLTRITDVAGRPDYRQYASNRAALDVTCVTGTLVGPSERVYYWIAGGGVGLVTDGLPGTIYTTNDGLVSDNVTAVGVYGGDLFVGTPAGISRFANNLFTTVNDGLTDLQVNDLALDTDGSLLAATGGGLFRWNDAAGTWENVGGQTAAILEVSAAGGRIYVRRNGVVQVHDGAAWQTLGLPAGAVSAIHAGDDFWIGGTAGVNVAGEYTLRSAYLGRLDGASTFTTWEVPASQVQSASAVALSGGAPYIGAQLWESVVSFRDGDTWDHVRYRSTGGEGDRLGVGVLLDMDRGPDGSVWVGMYAGTGLARINPNTGVTTVMDPTNSGLLGRQIIGVVAHPDGPVITGHDQDNEIKVEILVDPDNWAEPGSWLALPNSRLGAVASTDVWDALVERRDVIWFTVSDVGLVRWDINGPGAGPDDPLTWFDDTDDSWATVSSLPGTLLDPGAAFALELGADGSIWVGGNGLVQFTYDESNGAVARLTAMAEKSSSEVVGLVNGNVVDLARDHNGHIWVATAAGLNRVRGSGSDVEVDAYMDLGNYLANDTTRELYTIGAVKPLPGTVYRHICASEDGRRILVSADQGAALMTVGRGGESGETTPDAAYVYPNPYVIALAADGLKLGGLPEGTRADVTIYNLDGQIVYERTGVQVGTVFWRGQNRVRNEVTSGMYLVRVTANGASYAVPLSVVR